MAEVAQGDRAGRRVDERVDGRFERRLVWLMAGRLLLSLLSFGIAIGLDGFGPELTEASRRGLYWSVAFAFLATVLSGAWFGRIRDTRRFAILQIAMDVTIVTSLIHFSGGRDSVFVFLYALVTVYGSLLHERRGAMLAASMSAAAYAVALLASNEGWLLGFQDPGEPLEASKLLGAWAVHVSGLFLVGGLASILASEVYRTGKALDERTSDLRQLRDLHQHTVESLMSGLTTVDLEMRITSMNPEAERILGISGTDSLGRSIEEVIEGAGSLIEKSPRMGPEESHLRSRLQHARASGEELSLGIAASELKDEEGQLVGYVVIFQDVTQVVAMEEDLRRSERLAAVGEMAAKMAHEIRNPLAAISGSIQILQSGAPDAGEGDEPEKGRLMEIVVRETDRLNGLIEDFLMYSRPRPLRRAQVQLDGLIGDFVEVFEASLPKTVSLDLSAVEAVGAWIDADQLRQVLWNLCINGVEAMPEGGTLRLSARYETPPPPQGGGTSRRSGERDSEPGAMGRWIRLSIQDTGAGISREVESSIFEPFFTTKKRGSGLGLALVHRIVESHGGALKLESEIGSGTRISIWLPDEETTR